MTIESHTLGTPKKTFGCLFMSRAAHTSHQNIKQTYLVEQNILVDFEDHGFPLLLRFSEKYAILAPNTTVWSGNIPPCQFSTQTPPAWQRKAHCPEDRASRWMAMWRRMKNIGYKVTNIYLFRFHIMVIQQKLGDIQRLLERMNKNCIKVVHFPPIHVVSI